VSHVTMTGALGRMRQAPAVSAAVSKYIPRVFCVSGNGEQPLPETRFAQRTSPICPMGEIVSDIYCEYLTDTSG